MISQQECADYLNNAIENDLTIKEKNNIFNRIGLVILTNP